MPAAKHELKGRLAPLGVVAIGCQKLCPRGGVTVIMGARPHAWLVVEPDVSAEQVIAMAGVGASAMSVGSG